MSRHVAVLALLAALAEPAAAAPATITLPVQAAPADPMAAARAMIHRRTRADCVAEAAASADILVCAPLQDQALPVPEIYGPVAGSTDGAAVDPTGVPCGASISNQCGGGIDVLRTVAGAIKLVGLLVDPDGNLGEGDPIPERFRGANR